VELRPSTANAGQLELAVTVIGGHPNFRVEMGNPEDSERLLLIVTIDDKFEGTQVIALDADSVSNLLRERVVTIVWHDHEQRLSAEFPVNVTSDAREKLPFADPSLLPREGDLVAFYQGKISLADAFPQSTERKDTAEGTVPATQSVVDTSEILSYQIRDFVEALPGIRRELARNIATAPMIRLSYLGPVSPVALAKEIAKKIAKGRSSTAGGFQLLELLECVRSVQPEAELQAKLRRAWEQAKSEATAEIRQLYDALKANDEGFRGNSSFAQFESLLFNEIASAL
jgi:hypothetical protein